MENILDECLNNTGVNHELNNVVVFRGRYFFPGKRWQMNIGGDEHQGGDEKKITLEDKRFTQF